MTATTSRRVVSVEFADYTDLQSRLVLLPRIEEEGRGAVVAAFMAPEPSDTSSEGPPSISLLPTAALAASSSLQSRPGNASSSPDDAPSILGFILIGLGRVPSGAAEEERSVEKDWTDWAFSDILAHIRHAPTPLILFLASSVSPLEEKEVALGKLLYAPPGEDEEKKSEADDEVLTRNGQGSLSSSSDLIMSSGVSPRPEHPSKSQDENSEATQVNPLRSPTSLLLQPKAGGTSSITSSTGLLGDWSSWTTRVRETSAHMAAEAASSAAAVAQAAKERAARHAAQAALLTTTTTSSSSFSSSSSTTSSRTGSQEPSQAERSQPFGLFIQSSTGAILPLTGLSSAAERRISNSSLLLVRQSVLEPCPMGSCSFQWYRASRSGLVVASGDDASAEWIKLEGAIHAAFQPSAMEVGYRLRCVIQFADEDADATMKQVTCDSDDIVTAALPLFNGAKQALARGALFSGLTGRDKAEGRVFRLKIERRPEDSNPGTSALTVYQVSGDTAEPIHPENQPIVGVWAKVDYGNPKAFAMNFPKNQVLESASMLLALCSEDGDFKLQAANRLARESLLLAVGLANYTGKQGELTEMTALFGQAPSAEPSILGNDGPEPTQDEGSAPEANVEYSYSSAISDEASSSALPPSPPPDPRLQRCISLDSCHHIADANRIVELEQEIQRVQEKQARKDKIIAELQRQLATSESLVHFKDGLFASLNEDVCLKDQKLKENQESIARMQKQIDSRDDQLKSLQESMKVERNSLERKIDSQSETIFELEKSVRSLQNDKAVLSAAVEARESKLWKLTDLQSSYDKICAMLAEQELLRQETEDSNKRYRDAILKMEREAAKREDVTQQLEQYRCLAKELQQQVNEEKAKTSSVQAELHTQQMKMQKLKAERNSYKQRSDSLSKEIGLVCRNGRTIRDVEKILNDDAARREEVDLLREQKRKALNEMQQYRAAYDQVRTAQKLSGVDHDHSKILERNAELERLLSELTEYVDAKEMQLQTLREVNETLQMEIRGLAQSHMSKHDV